MQGGSTGVGYGLKYQARCITDVKADTDHTSFLTGTLSLKEENEVHLIRLSSDGTELVCEGLFSHPNEIWDLASCPFDQRIFSTVFSSGESYEAAVWQIPELYGQSNSPQLECIASLDAHNSKINVLWWPSGRHDKLISIDEQNIFLWSLDSSKKSAQVQSQESAGMLHHLSGGSWDPHDLNVVASTSESSIQFWDLRTMKYVPIDQDLFSLLITSYFGLLSIIYMKEELSLSLPQEHGHGNWLAFSLLQILQLNPSKKTNSIEHSHVRNIDYDRKKKHMLSSGTDSAVNLWFACPSNDELTSESLSNSTTTRWTESLLHSYTDYEDSVYASLENAGLSWSSREPWIFASLSYDGR
ncbi:hypothetical protein Ccrd_013914, partial [Cynara cardunculus var. scolymus]